MNKCEAAEIEVLCKPSEIGFTMPEGPAETFFSASLAACVAVS